MAKYLLQVNYVGDGVKGLLKEGGTKRRAVAEKAAKSLGGKLEAFYFAFGDTDAYVIADMPDNVSAAAISLTVGASGVATARTTVLMTAAEMDEAAAKTPVYRPPGK
ncbi:MAG: GYD domain-containing protein [Burkholderiaceae bacterium]|nr:GYD domain-containing protein [Burkholderiaceae bacterium]